MDGGGKAAGMVSRLDTDGGMIVHRTKRVQIQTGDVAVVRMRQTVQVLFVWTAVVDAGEGVVAVGEIQLLRELVRLFILADDDCRPRSSTC